MDFRVYKGDLDPEFRIYSFGAYENPVSPTHINYYAEIVVCLEGEITLNVCGKERVLHANEGCVIHPLEAHGFLKGDNKILVFCFSPLVFGELLKTPPEKRFAVGEVPQPCLSYVKYLTETPLEFPKDERKIRLVLSCLLSEIPRLSACPEQSLAICRAMMYLEEHFSEKLSLDTVAAAIGVNRFYACSVFPKYLNGMTFIRVLNQIRVQNAVKLLAQTSVSNAAMESGFGSIRQFNRVFREITGSTPREYQKSVQYEPIYEERRIF